MKKICLILLILGICACTSKNEVGVKPPPSNLIQAAISEGSTQYDANAYSNYVLKINIDGGHVNFNNIDGYADFNPIAFSIKNGEQKTIKMTKAGDNFFRSTTILSVSYKDGRLWLDTKPNPYVLIPNASPSRELSFNQRWLIGDKYSSINTQGEAGLEQANITVKLTPKVA